MYMVVAACRAFLYTANNTEVHGLEKFLKLLESRADLESRTRGLITGMDGNNTAALRQMPSAALLRVIFKRNKISEFLWLI